MKLFGHEFGKKVETPVQPTAETQVATPTATTEVTPAVAPEATPMTKQEITSPAPAVADLGAQADKLAAMINSEVAVTGGLDTPAPAAVPEAPTIAEQVAVLDTSAEATFTVPQISEQAPVTSPAAAEKIATEAPTPATEITVDPTQDATAAEDSDTLWKQFDTTAPAETTTPTETQQ